MQSHDITRYSVLDLLSWQENGTLHVSPKFQRRSVWSSSARGHFIDSLLLEYPIPPIHIRLVSDPIRGGAIREVVDGQQRIRAVFDFIGGRYRIPPSVSDNWGGKSFARLTDDERERIRLFAFTVYQYKQLTDAEVLNIFARLNTFSVRLNAQELRNGRYFGEFKRRSFSLATDALEFWRSHRIFSDSQVARMAEAQLTSELLIASMDGLQDKKASVNDFYAQLDDAWGEEPVSWSVGGDGRVAPARYLSGKAASRRFEQTLAAIESAAGDLIAITDFRRPAVFYTLYCVVYHILFGLPREEEDKFAGVGMSRSIELGLQEAVGRLADARIEEGWSTDRDVAAFFQAATSQTDNIGPRRQRFRSLLALVERGIRA